MKIKVIEFKNMKMPVRAHYNDSGADVFAAESTVIPAGKIAKIPLGIGVEIPDGYDGVIYCKSGLSSKGVWASNSPIDSGYRGEIHAILANLSDETVEICQGEKVGQLVIRPVIYADFVNCLGEERGEGAFGSTGK